MIKNPISVYINWAAYDEISDNVVLTEVIAMEQLDYLFRRRGSRNAWRTMSSQVF
jgi:hypothetical protein